MPSMQTKMLWLCADGLTRYSLLLLAHRVFLSSLEFPNTLIPSSKERTVKPLIMKGDKSFLPDDIIVNILKRLSVKCLIRFQCVCKHWKNLFKSPSFIADHLHHSSHQNPLLILRWRQFRSSGFRWVLLDCDMQEHVVQSSPSIRSLCYFRIFGSSNGLLCLNGVPRNFILLWNPATKEIRQVPITLNDFKGLYHIGFGFSPIINDYKIVIIYMPSKEGSYQVNRVEVYSLRSKLWKEVEFRNLESLCVNSDSVSVNGDVFWLGFKGGKSEYDGHCSVVSFDIANEMFTLIPMPALDGRLIKKLTVYKNNLAMLCVKLITHDGYCVQLWVMEEGSGTSGERRIWTNKYTSNLCQGLSMLYPITVWNNEIICKAEFDSKGEDDDPSTFLYLFNLASNELKTVGIGNPKYEYDLLINNYVESLVSIDNIHVENP